MSETRRTERVISLDRIFLHHENPRHEPYEEQEQVIEWLCGNEEVPQLARDITKNGLSPLDRFGVILDHDTEGDDATYITVEGNRRLCALKLLTDPDLAPPGKKSYFEKLAGDWSPIGELPCVIFEDQNDLDLWLKRRHHGTMGGIGQKDWNADQKSRHSGVKSRNQVALEFLDYTERENLISAEKRKRRLTTVQRYLSNPVMRETLGLDVSEPGNIKRNRTEDDFRLLSKRFIDDMLADEPKVNSRQNTDSIVAYARELSSMPGQNHRRVDAEPIRQEAETPTRGNPSPRQAAQPQKLPWKQEINAALKELGNWKLENLYYSLVSVYLNPHTPLLAVGVWSFFETLTASAGRNPQTSFHSFLSRQRLMDYGLGTKAQTDPLRAAVERILHYGNATKHHNMAAAFNGKQLYNDVDSLEKLILKVIDEAIAKER